MKRNIALPATRSVTFIFFIIISFFLAVVSGTAHAQLITLYAGSGVGSSGDGGPATAAQFIQPWGIAQDRMGNTYICDGSRVRKVDPTGIITTCAGTVAFVPLGDGGPATAASLNNAYDVIADTSGNIYIADHNHSRVRKVDATGIITTYAGTGTPGYSGDGVAATASQLNLPAGLALDSVGNLYISEWGNNRVRKVDAAGIITTVVGNGTGGYTGDGMAATASELYWPSGLAFDRYHNLYIADIKNNRIRKVDTAGMITTVAGDGTFSFGGDGLPATAANLDNPYGVRVDACGDIYVTDTHNNRVRAIDHAGTITTIAGDGTAAYLGDGGPASSAELYYPMGVWTDKNCNIFIGDWQNYRVRKIGTYDHAPFFTGGHTGSIAVCQNTGAVAIDSQLQVTDVDSAQTEVWSIATPSMHGTAAAAYTTTSTGGVLTPSGMYYTPASGYSGNDTFRVQVTDCAAFSDTVTFYVTVHPLPNAGVISGPSVLPVCFTRLLTDTVSGGVWGSTNHAVATISTSGLVSPVSLGNDTITYTVNNAWCTASTKFPIQVVMCEGVPYVPGSMASLKVSPNPGNGAFTFRLTSTVNEEAYIVITNLMGEKVLGMSTTTNKPQEILLNAPGGIYFLTAITAHGVWSEKIVVTK